MRLYEIPIEFQKLEDLLVESGGELTPELEAHLESLQLVGAEKVDAAACVLQGMKAGAEALAGEIGRLSERKAALESAQERLRALMLPAVRSLGGKVKTDRFTIYIATRRGYAIELKPGCEVWELPPNFYRARDPELAKTEIKKHLEAGGEVPEALSVVASGTITLTVK